MGYLYRYRYTFFKDLEFKIRFPRLEAIGKFYHDYLIAEPLVGYVDGYSEDDWKIVLSMDVAYYKSKTILLRNRDPDNSFDYYVYGTTGGILEDTIDADTLSPNSSKKVIIPQEYSRILVLIRSSTAGASARYHVEYSFRIL